MELGRSLSEQRALHNSAIARNAERKVQLAAAYGDDELEYTQQELEEWHTSMAPRLQEMAKAVDTLAQDILVDCWTAPPRQQYPTISQLSDQYNMNMYLLMRRTRPLIAMFEDLVTRKSISTEGISHIIDCVQPFSQPNVRVMTHPLSVVSPVQKDLEMTASFSLLPSQHRNKKGTSFD